MDVVRIKPKHVPDWLWSNYESDLQNWDSETDEDEKAELASSIHAYSRLIVATGMTKAWQALKKREWTYERLQLAHFRTWANDTAISNLMSKGDWSEMFAYQCKLALTGFDGVHLMTKRELDAAAAAVVDAAATLQIALKAIGWRGYSSDETLVGINRALQIHARSQINKLRRYQENKDLFASRASEEGLLLGAQCVSFDTYGLLNALKKGVSEVAIVERLISKPNDKNAARLYFLRALTNFCQKSYGAPLRAVVYSACEVFFDCSDIDANDLTNLAPVPKTSEREK